MFDIEYKGGNTVVIATKKLTVVFDPKQSLIGLKDYVAKDALQIATEPRFVHDDTAYRLIVDGPGEYEIADVSMRGIVAMRHIDDLAVAPGATIYQLEIGGIRIAVLGNISDKLSEDQLEALGVIDVVILPVGGGGYTLDATSAASAVRQIEPKVVIPVHYADEGLRYEVPQDTIDTFTGELSAPVEQVASKYKLKGTASLPQALTVIVIDRSS